MASKGYFPSKDAEVIPWVENFVQVATANAAALGLGTADITALKTKNADYSGKLIITRKDSYIFSGTFSGTLKDIDGTKEIKLTNGTFDFNLKSINAHIFP